MSAERILSDVCRKPIGNKVFTSFLAATHRQVGWRVGDVASAAGWDGDVSTLLPSKMLRTAWAGRLMATGVCPAASASIVSACVATELVHAATLCHDDVIDNATVRRGGQSLWVTLGASMAVLIGDMLLCDALGVIAQIESGRLTGDFAAKVQETLAAEVRQELQLRGEALEPQMCLEIARGKTGPLFAFVSGACGGDDVPMTAALAEAGYCVGTAYQLLDDLLDVYGSEELIGKTLGTDRFRGKYTLAQSPRGGGELLLQQVQDQCAAAEQAVSAWPELAAAVRAFVCGELQAVVDKQNCLRVELAT